MNTTTPFYYAIYTRQSKSSDAVMSSCDAQFALCEDFVKMRAAPNWQWIGERFDDEKMPGDRLHRPGLDRLREQIRAGTVQYVVVYALDRLSRKMKHCLQLLNEMLEHDVEFSVVLNPDLDTTTGKGQVMTGVLAALAEFEHDLIKSRIRDKFEFLRQKGRRLAGRVPFGYSADPGNKQLVIDETEAPLVKMMFTLAAQGRLPREIAETLNALSENVKPSGSYSSRERRPWTPRQVLSTPREPIPRRVERVPPEKACRSRSLTVSATKRRLTILLAGGSVLRRRGFVSKWRFV
jgi:site-specific DNA recombinase